MATQIYALFWVRDDPPRLVPDERAQPVLLMRSARHIAERWQLMDCQLRGITPAGAPFLLGERIGMLDLCVAAASRRTSGRRRFAQVAPHLLAAVQRVDVEARLQAVWAERFPVEEDEVDETGNV